jgi:hypothetical protein
VADPELLKTCFLNLMINAVDAMPEGGALEIAVRRGGAAADQVEALVVTVRDNGHGMSNEDIQSAFEPYFSTKDTGFGLGPRLDQEDRLRPRGHDRPREHPRLRHHGAHHPAPRGRPHGRQCLARGPWSRDSHPASDAQRGADSLGDERQGG